MQSSKHSCNVRGPKRLRYPSIEILNTYVNSHSPHLASREDKRLWNGFPSKSYRCICPWWAAFARKSVLGDVRFARLHLLKWFSPCIAFGPQMSRVDNEGWSDTDWALISEDRFISDPSHQTSYQEIKFKSRFILSRPRIERETTKNFRSYMEAGYSFLHEQRSCIDDTVWFYRAYSGRCFS